jgi:hypothetical protein
MSNTTTKRFYSVTDAAIEAGCTTSFIRQKLRSGAIKGEKVGVRAWIIPSSQLRFLKQNPGKTVGRPRIGK